LSCVPAALFIEGVENGCHDRRIEAANFFFFQIEKCFAEPNGRLEGIESDLL
jgi:hypothetical protein